MIHATYNRGVRHCSRQRVAGAVMATVLLLLLYNYELIRATDVHHLMDLRPHEQPDHLMGLPHETGTVELKPVETFTPVNIDEPLKDATPPVISSEVVPAAADPTPPVDGQRKPDDGQRKPDEGQRKPDEGQRKPDEGQSKPVEEALPEPPSKDHDSLPDMVCDEVKAWDDIVISVKTGATEAFEKIPTQFMTTLKCAKHVLLFSDMEQDIGPYHIYDALDEVPEAVKSGNDDFDLYRLQQEYKAAGQDIRNLNLNKEKSGAAWSLDKYKNIHMAQKTYKMKPGASWYFFIDADTYIVWPSLLRWLERLDPNEPLWMGTATYLGIAFAHGGSGYILSKATMKGFLENNADVATKFDESVRHDCCGDFSMAKALYESNFRLTRVWPMTQGEKPRTLPFGPSRWCQPVVTMHHVKSEEVSEIWQYERTRKNQSEPLLYEEIYRAFLEPKISEAIDEWDNQSESCLFKSPDVKPHESAKNRWEMSDVERDAYKSFEHCGAACKADRGCYQWKYFDETCALDWSFKLGEKQLPGAKTKIRSGWDIEKINEFRQQRPCQGPQWVEDKTPVGYKKVGTEYVETKLNQQSE